MNRQSHRIILEVGVDRLQALPEPGTEWRSSAVPTDVARQLAQLEHGDVVRRVRAAEGQRPRWVWETDADSWAHIQELVAGSDDGLLPCGHSALHNRRGPGIECQVCGVVHDREEVVSA